MHCHSIAGFSKNHELVTVASLPRHPHQQWAHCQASKPRTEVKVGARAEPALSASRLRRRAYSLQSMAEQVALFLENEENRAEAFDQACCVPPCSLGPSPRFRLVCSVALVQTFAPPDYMLRAQSSTC